MIYTRPSRLACLLTTLVFGFMSHGRKAQVLFDLPDFMIVSAYTLLAVVWAEAFLQVVGRGRHVSLALVLL